MESPPYCWGYPSFWAPVAGAALIQCFVALSATHFSCWAQRNWQAHDWGECSYARWCRRAGNDPSCGPTCARYLLCVDLWKGPREGGGSWGWYIGTTVCLQYGPRRLFSLQHSWVAHRWADGIRMLLLVLQASLLHMWNNKWRKMLRVLWLSWRALFESPTTRPLIQGHNWGRVEWHGAWWRFTNCIVLYLQPVLNPESYGSLRRVLPSSSR